MTIRLQGLEPPINLTEIAASLKSKYGNLSSSGKFQLSNGRHITLQDLRHALNAYTTDRSKSQAHQDKTPLSPSNALDVYLDRLFSAKQKELVFKKREGRALTKTEREYFSRIVRKKLEAITNEDVVGLAREVINNKHKSDTTKL